ncbi:Acetylcholine receptor subunit alpha-type acr-16 [Amphibalanus amphitrite]|uniref:Acetylcholine receptor subunit alpha-type acr-16 n=1 Tax=Amphibalanus amphitrite TaxID=1232801 RepID=A0A6A4W8M6_AMPAM|nr:Acetylcholine receptor subunit alpha-type acr-16 [Amphibalanus amphitrite]
MLRAALCCLALAGLAAGDNEELKLAPLAGPQRHLMVRPVDRHDDQLSVTLGFMPVDIDVDEKELKTTVGGWLFLSWQNSRLAWSGGPVERTRIMPGDMWTPDIYPYNMVPTVSEWLLPTPALVSRSGEVIYVPPVSVQVRCRRQQASNPDRIVCPLKLGSWTYSTDQVDLKRQSNSVDLSGYEPAGRDRVLAERWLPLRPVRARLGPGELGSELWLDQR